jgi:hypothetical protein
MSARTKRQRRMGMGLIGAGFPWRGTSYGLVGLLAVVCSVYAALPSGHDRRGFLHPSQEVAVESEANFLMSRIEAAVALSPKWTDEKARDSYVATLKKWHQSHEILACRFGVPEIAQNETIEAATRVVIPIESMTRRNRTTGEVLVNRVQDSSDPSAQILEKRDSPTGPRWYLLDNSPDKADVKESGWLSLPRKKMANLPAVELRRAIVVRAILEGKVVSERVIFADDPNSR